VMGPLQGTKIIELAGVGPGPFCGMMLADMGAAVIRVERPGAVTGGSLDPLLRNRRSIACDLQRAEGVDVVLRLIENADALFEGFRPGVAERLGVGPDTCLKKNPRLVYGRMTGWGQEGPLARAAGHDLNYIALSGALHSIGRPGDKPVPPLNLVGDFGGGGMLLAFGMVCALLNAQRTGKGQIVDAAMIDGANTLMAMFHGFKAMGLHSDATGSSFLGGAAHFYDTYETRDGKFISIASIEPRFYELLIEKAGLDRRRFAAHAFRMKIDDDVRSNWATLKEELAEVIRTRTRDEWCDIMEGSDVCFAPVLTLDEARAHPHNKSRHAFIDVDGQTQAAPAPRFSESVTATPRPGVPPGTHSVEILQSAGFDAGEIRELIESGTVAAA